LKDRPDATIIENQALAEALDEALEGSVKVILGSCRRRAHSTLGWATANLRTRFGRIIRPERPAKIDVASDATVKDNPELQALADDGTNSQT
jgi:uncharacterized protein (DUF2126 family)